MYNLNVLEYKNFINNKIDLKENDVHLWLFSTSTFNKDIPDFFQNLSLQEKEILSNYRRVIDKQNYIIRHGVAKELLKRYLPKKEINFSYNEHLKPFIKGINFNIAQSGNYFACAFSLSNQVGVDIQEIRPTMFLASMIEEYFSEEEKNYFSKNDSYESFFYIWCKKEAILKSLGLGLSQELKKINTIDSLNKDDKWSLIKTSLSDTDIWVTSLKKEEKICMSIALS